MLKQKKHNELYWDAMKKNQIKEEYKRFLANSGEEDNSTSAHIFAMKMVAGNHNYQGMTERELILFLAGELPEMYD
jgi:hypothetical protein